LLSSSFDNIVTTFLFEKETLKFDEVVVALLMDETRRISNRLPNKGQAWVAKELIGVEDGPNRRGERFPGPR